MIGERFGEWLKPLLMKRGLGVMEVLQGLPLQKRSLHLFEIAEQKIPAGGGDFYVSKAKML